LWSNNAGETHGLHDTEHSYLTHFLICFFSVSKLFELTTDGEKQNDRLDGLVDEVKKPEIE
jgi:hypothetical protein